MQKSEHSENGREASARPEPTWRGVYRRLRLSILDRELPPASRLIELDLAKVLGVSRTPLREALARLEVDGLVSVAKSGGYVVTDLREDLSDAYDLRCAIEGHGARLAAERMTVEQIERLRASVEISRTIPLHNSKRRSEMNVEFHQMVIEGTRSPKIIHNFNNIRDLILTDEDMTLHTEEAHAQFIREHELILTFIEMRDGDSADKLMRRHLASARDLLLVGADNKRAPGPTEEK